MESKNYKELALMQVEKARKNIEIAMKLIDYPESMEDDWDLVDGQLENMKWKIKELELIDSYIEDTPPTDSEQSIWYLGKSIELLAQADYFIGINDFHYPGCQTEFFVARNYGIKVLMIDICQYSFFNDIF